VSPKTGSKQRLTLIEAARRREDLAEDKDRARHILHSVSRVSQNNTGHQEIEATGPSATGNSQAESGRARPVPDQVEIRRTHNHSPDQRPDGGLQRLAQDLDDAMPTNRRAISGH
jgi:hypothetical protein